MFSPSTVGKVSGELIDHPFNAMTLCQELHKRFGGLEMYFEATEVSCEFLDTA